jgi:hypothetical protein
VVSEILETELPAARKRRKSCGWCFLALPEGIQLVDKLSPTDRPVHCSDRAGRAERPKAFRRNVHQDIPTVVEAMRQYWMPIPELRQPRGKARSA